MSLSFCLRPLAGAALFVALCAASTAVRAQVVLGYQYRPHYWDLPTDFKDSFVFPGQTYVESRSDRAFDGRGRRIDTGVDTRMRQGFTIIPRFFKFDPESRWAYALGLSLFEMDLRSGNTRQTGMGPLIPSFTGWTKPTPNTTVGFDALVSTPFALSSELAARRWDGYLRGFVDANVNNWNLEAVVGWQGALSRQSGQPRPQDQWHLNLRAGYDFHLGGDSASGRRPLRITPYAAFDHQRARDGNAWVSNAGAGLMFTHGNGVTWSAAWTRSVAGRNMPVSNGLVAQFWFPF